MKRQTIHGEIAKFEIAWSSEVKWVRMVYCLYSKWVYMYKSIYYIKPTTSGKKHVSPVQKIGIWHCAAIFFSQVPKKCTDLDLIHSGIRNI